MEEAKNAASTNGEVLPPTEGDDKQPLQLQEPLIPPDKVLHSIDSEIEEEERDSWGSKLAYMLTLVGYAVGFGNIWRFPYLLHSNGGAAFLIPYCLMLAFEGIPIFFLELAIGQRLRKGALGSWNEISPYLGGVGISCGLVCYFVCMYYNTLIAWVLSYLFDSFRDPLPWKDCETASSGLDGKSFTRDDTLGKNVSKECIEANQASKFYWFRRVLDVSDSIETAGNFNPWIMLYLIVSWIVIWAILVKGIKTSEKVVYFTALFPYVTLLCFFIGNFFQDGWKDGYRVLFKPDFSVLLNPTVWLTAGTQIFFSLGVAYGCLIVFASYLPSNNNCYRDAVYVSLINCGTSLLAAIVIFPVLGFSGTLKYNKCITQRTVNLLGDLDQMGVVFDPPILIIKPINFKTRDGLAKRFALSPDEGKGLITQLTDTESIKNKSIIHKFPVAIQLSEPLDCDLEEFIRKSGSGTGLVFIAFAEAALHLPCPQFWCFLFFFMLFTLGVDSSFGTCEGAISAVADMKILPWPRWALTTAICGSLLIFSMPFCFGFGIYIQVFLDSFIANWGLLTVAFFELIGVAWVYGLAQFSYDILLMTGTKPNLFMLVCWKFISPVLLIVILLMSIVYQFLGGYNYDKYNKIIGNTVETPYPRLIIGIGYVLFITCIIWVPLQAILVYFGKSLLKVEKPAYFPEEELRAERNMDDDDDDLDSFGNFDRLLMGKSVEDLAAYREKEKAKSATTLSTDEKKSAGGGV